MNAYYTRAVTPVYNSTPHIKEIAPGEIVDVLSRTGDLASIEYTTRSDKKFYGNVEWVYLEKYFAIGNPVVDMTPYQTPTPQDPDQYLYIYKKAIYNVCGVASLCEAFKIDLMPMLQIMHDNPKTLGYYNSIISNKGLGISAVETIAMAAGARETKRLYEALRHNGKVIMSPGRINEFLQDGWQLILGVTINYLGVVMAAGYIQHWTGIKRIRSFGINNGTATFYNSMRNSYEDAAYAEVIASAKRWNSFSGVLIML